MNIQEYLKSEEEVFISSEGIKELQEENLINIVAASKEGFHFCFKEDENRINYYSFNREIAYEVIEKVLFPGWYDLTPSDLIDFEE